MLQLRVEDGEVPDSFLLRGEEETRWGKRLNVPRLNPASDVQTKRLVLVPRPCWWHTIPLSTHHAGAPVVPLRLVEVDGEIIQRPGESQVHGWIVGRVALQGEVLTDVDVGARWCQRDFGGICRERVGRAVSSCKWPPRARVTLTGWSIQMI